MSQGAPEPLSQRYEWPPLPVLDVDEAATLMAERLGYAYDDLEAERIRVLTSLTMGRKRLVDRWLREFLTTLDALPARVTGEVARFLQLHVGPRYAQGAEAATGQPHSWTQPHMLALTALAVDTYQDFLQRAQQAGRVGQAFAAAVREASGRELPKIAAGGRTARQVADRLEARLLDEYGITTVTYRNGARVPVRVYARMAARTKSAVAYNAGTLNGCVEAEVGYVEILDGSDCGWRTHDDDDKANGTVRSLAEAALHPISHPNCRRALAPRPDVRTDAEAAQAAPSVSEEAQADQDAFDRLQRPAPRTRAAVLRRARQDAKRTARRLGVTAVDDTAAVVNRILRERGILPPDGG